MIYLKSGRLFGGAFQRERSFALAVAAASTTRPPLTGRAADNIAIERTAAISIVFGALADPRTNGISVADRQLLLAVRHTHVR